MPLREVGQQVRVLHLVEAEADLDGFLDTVIRADGCLSV
jgi:hypothetical protein